MNKINFCKEIVSNKEFFSSRDSVFCEELEGNLVKGKRNIYRKSLEIDALYMMILIPLSSIKYIRESNVGHKLAES